MINKLCKLSNWKKTYYYLKKNGVKAAFMAALERLETSENDSYFYVEPSEEVLKYQREMSKDGNMLFSILVPVYKTPEKYFLEMVQSVLEQSYTHWELLLGDASPDERLKKLIDKIGDARIKYVKIPENKGISENTNYILERAKGQYIGLLDHDDVLTKDALYCVYEEIKSAAKEHQTAKFIYSDEDKGDGEMKKFYDFNHKPSFDQDYLWSNNYICHFSVLEAELMKRLRFRKEFDGAQDFDLFLRAAREMEKERKMLGANSQVRNISKVLYHWRCHQDSTAVNPQSKLYAYNAGKLAVEDDLRERGIAARVSHSKHLGFYQVSYEDIFRDRPEVAMITGPTYKRGRIHGGARNQSDTLIYGGLRKGFSGGHLHTASVWQMCYAGDFTNALVREDLFQEFLTEQGITGISKPQELPETLQDSVRIKWAEYVHRKSKIILYNPEME